jgi:hypothetical protein
MKIGQAQAKLHGGGEDKLAQGINFAWPKMISQAILDHSRLMLTLK